MTTLQMIVLIIGFFILSATIMVGQYVYVRWNWNQKLTEYLKNRNYQVIEICTTDERFPFVGDHLSFEAGGSSFVPGKKLVWKKAIVKNQERVEEEILIAIETVMSRPVRYHLKVKAL